MFEIERLRFKDILDIPRLTIDCPATCIVGASGSGKTTLLRHLNRLYEPDTGVIRYNGTPISEIDPVALRRRVVMLGQTPVLCDGTVADNLQLGLLLSQKVPASRAALEAVLDRVGLPRGPDDGCEKLSGGEKQRLCLARVLLMDAETYLLDEPSAALDRETEAAIVDLLLEFVRERGRELIIVTHSEQVSARFAGSIIRMERGQTRGYQV